MSETDKNTPLIPKIDGSGNNGTFQTGDDLADEVIETLADYLYCRTKDGRDGNKFRVAPGVEKVTARDSEGNPAALDPNAKGSENPYAPTSQNPALSQYSDSGKIFQPTIGEFLSKGDADTFIKDVGKGFTDTSGRSQPEQGIELNPALKAIDAALDNNRFSPGPRGSFAGFRNINTIDPTVSKIDDKTTKEVRVVARTQSDFGRYKADGFDIEMEDLKKIGESLMLRSAREIKAAQTGDPRSLAVGAAALIPGAAQIGVVKVDTNELKASRVLEDNFNYPTKPRTEIEGITNQSNRSWGQLNTQLEPYDGFLPIGMTGLAVALTVGIRLAIGGLLGVLGLIVKEKSFQSPTRGPFIAGQYGKPNPAGRLFSLKMIGIQDTEYDFLSAVSEGVDVFFAFDGTDFRRVVREPQFYTIFIRNITRSSNTIINEIRDVFSRNQNPLAAAQSVHGLIDVLKSSKIIAFLNIMAQLGDRSLAKQSLGYHADSKRISITENLAINPATNVMRVRNRRSQLRSGMDQAASISKFVFPTEVLKAGTLLGNKNIEKSMGMLPDSHVAKDDDTNSVGRIKPEVVREVEAQLDSEYVPFYYHDLRTNEIISFHAFLTSLEDTYTPQYESTQAYGRIDNVRTYSSTERTLTLSFNIIATNKESFDLMWWKINKLVTMVYPSWTEGRNIETDGNKFIQPFSQTPASTPLIRLRIGDLIRNNYSKFSLQRLFGAGTDKFNLVNNGKLPSSKEVDEKRKKISAVRDRMLRNPAVTGEPNDGYKAGETALLLPSIKGYAEAPALASKAKRAASLLLGRPLLKKRLITTTNTKVKVYTVRNSLLGLDEIKGAPLFGIGGYGEHGITYYKVEVDDSDGTSVPDEMKGQFIVTHDDLVPDPDTVLAASEGPLAPFSAQTNSEPPAEQDSATNPFSSDNNAIIRSFESVQGKGLGGVITGLTFTELVSPQVIWETGNFGSRAPKMIKVNMTFAVIHDIAPGIDSSGFMRAVQYPVGDIAHTINGDTYDGSNKEDAKSIWNDNHRKASRSLRNDSKKDGDGGGIGGRGL